MRSWRCKIFCKRDVFRKPHFWKNQNVHIWKFTSLSSSGSWEALRGQASCQLSCWGAGSGGAWEPNHSGNRPSAGEPGNAGRLARLIPACFPSKAFMDSTRSCDPFLFHWIGNFQERTFFHWKIFQPGILLLPLLFVHWINLSLLHILQALNSLTLSLVYA